MMKFKGFSAANAGKLDMKINEWLDENRTINLWNCTALAASGTSVLIGYDDLDLPQIKTDLAPVKDEPEEPVDNPMTKVGPVMTANEAAIANVHATEVPLAVPSESKRGPGRPRKEAN